MENEKTGMVQISLPVVPVEKPSILVLSVLIMPGMEKRPYVLTNDLEPLPVELDDEK